MAASEKMQLETMHFGALMCTGTIGRDSNDILIISRHKLTGRKGFRGMRGYHAELEGGGQVPSLRPDLAADSPRFLPLQATISAVRDCGPS